MRAPATCWCKDGQCFRWRYFYNSPDCSSKVVWTIASAIAERMDKSRDHLLSWCPWAIWKPPQDSSQSKMTTDACNWTTPNQMEGRSRITSWTNIHLEHQRRHLLLVATEFTGTALLTPCCLWPDRWCTDQIHQPAQPVPPVLMPMPGRPSALPFTRSLITCVDQLPS